ncbi:hypothetical protein GCM10023331_30410 [Algivirga pacifica]|uniref:Uncharacterized protein n=1 Tax=Algivirga pacifica TaxID=1162670 RepID=A0ABP9DG41_9BACT
MRKVIIYIITILIGIFTVPFFYMLIFLEHEGNKVGVINMIGLMYVYGISAPLIYLTFFIPNKWSSFFPLIIYIIFILFTLPYNIDPDDQSATEALYLAALYALVFGILFYKKRNR